MDRLVGVGTVTRPQPQTRRPDSAVGGLYAPMAVREQDIAVGVEKVGGSELAQIGGEIGIDPHTLRVGEAAIFKPR